ncbi:MAG: molybdopterin-dependent oxidoreductase [Bacillota bacterium]|nr:molybdopterin-dependent oxidoreductase [Bacillota bacterium]
MGKRLFAFSIAAVLLILMMAAAACSKPAENAAPEEGKEGEKLVITGLESTDIEVTVEELKSMESVTTDAVAIDSAGNTNTYTVTGPLLEDLLKKHGKSQRDLSGIRLVAGDGYSIEVPPEVLEARDVILAHTIDGQPLDEQSKPVRAVVPGERAMYWVRNLAKIEVLEGIKSTEVNRLYFIETGFSGTPAEDYTYYESTDKAVRVDQLISYLGIEDQPDTVAFKAVDGFEKNEQRDIFNGGYIKFTGDDTPAFLSPDLPKGMYIKNILWFTYGGNVVFSAEKGLECMDIKTAGEKQGIGMTDIISETGLSSAEVYLLTAEDGYTVEIEAGDMGKGIVYINDKGQVAVYFDGLPKNTSIKGLLSVEAVKGN